MGWDGMTYFWRQISICSFRCCSERVDSGPRELPHRYAQGLSATRGGDTTRQKRERADSDAWWAHTIVRLTSSLDSPVRRENELVAQRLVEIVVVTLGRHGCGWWVWERTRTHVLVEAKVTLSETVGVKIRRFHGRILHDPDPLSALVAKT